MIEAPGYLLDTNVISETRKTRPDAGVTSFLQSTDPAMCYLSVLTLGELRKGVEVRRRRDAGAAKLLSGWIDGIEHGFSNRILSVDAKAAKLWGELSAGRTRPVVDTLLAATAILHEFVLVTRNIDDVSDLPVKILNPFAG